MTLKTTFLKNVLILAGVINLFNAYANENYWQQQFDKFPVDLNENSRE
jgi:hypothetical protein